MSLENHPNFDAVKFATLVVSAYYECKRNEKQTLPSIHEYVIDFVTQIEEVVDQYESTRIPLE